MYKTTVVVDGMHCSMCESQVKSLVMKILPDAKLSASHRKGTLTVEGSFIPSGNLLRKALKDGGYEVKDISTEKVEKETGTVLVFIPRLEVSLNERILMSRKSGFFLFCGALKTNFFLWLFVLLSNHSPESPKCRQTKTSLKTNSSPALNVDVMNEPKD